MIKSALLPNIFHFVMIVFFYMVTMKKCRNSETDDSFKAYVCQIKKIPVLSADEELELFQSIQNGDKMACHRLIEANLWLVVNFARTYIVKGIPLIDLIQEGNIGLMRAVKRYNPRKGVRFSTYAIWWIRLAINNAICQKGRMIRLPHNKTSAISRMEKTRELIRTNSGRKSGAETGEIAMYLDMSPEKAQKLMQISQDVLSLEEPVRGTEDSLTIKDYIEDKHSHSPAEHAMNSCLKDDLEEALDRLDRRDAEVLRCRFGLGNSHTMTLQEVGERLNISKERIRQIETRALHKLRSNAGKLREQIEAI